MERAGCVWAQALWMHALTQQPAYGGTADNDPRRVREVFRLGRDSVAGDGARCRLDPPARAPARVALGLDLYVAAAFESFELLMHHGAVPGKGGRFRNGRQIAHAEG